MAFSGLQVHSIVDKDEEESEGAIETMLDSGSTVTRGKDRKLFTSISDLDRKVKMKTNAGSKQISQEGCWRGYSNAYYMPSAMTNIVSLSDAIEKGFTVFMDTVPSLLKDLKVRPVSFVYKPSS